MNRRLAVLAAAFAATALAVPADAAKVVCLQIQDETGDGTNGVVPNQDSLDILSGDIATGKKNLVGVLRMKSVNPDQILVGGVTYQLKFASGGTPYVLSYRTYGMGEPDADIAIGDSINGGSTFAVDFAVDPNTGTITWTVPRKSIPALKKPGAKFSGLAATSAISNNMKGPTGTSRGSTSADSAETAKTYVDGTTTCVKGT
jgi:hypothetical protein